MVCHLEFIQILLSNGQSKYVLGEEVKGVLRLGLKEQSVLKKLNISLVGLEEVKWFETPEGVEAKPDIEIPKEVHQESVELINLSLPKQEAQLAAGEHDLPFSFKLPEKDLPSSFAGSHGSIVYFIKVIVDDADMPDGQRVTRKEISVDNQNVNAPMIKRRASIGGYNEKTVDHVGIGKIRLYASLPQKSFTPGEIIEVHTTVENESTIMVKPVATLYQQQQYICGDSEKDEEVTLTDRVYGNQVGAMTNTTQTLSVPIPEDSSLTIKSQLIDIKYFLHVSLTDLPNPQDIDIDMPFVMVSKKANNNE